jgi:hypothetical protein
MPHIPGHVEDPPTSVGILSLSIDKDIKDENRRRGLFFVPPKFKFESKADNEIGFLPLEIPTGGGSILIAYFLIKGKAVQTKKGLKFEATDLKDDQAADNTFSGTAEYKTYYDGTKDNSELALERILPTLKTVGELRRIKKACELTGNHLIEQLKSAGKWPQPSEVIQ